MAQTIEARVRQKAQTLSAWNNSELESLDGEQLFIRSDIDDKVIGFKLGSKGKKFRDLPFPDFTVRDKAEPTTVFTGKPSGLYIPIYNGSYQGGVTVTLSDGYQVLYWDGSVLFKVVYPIDYIGVVYGGIIDDSVDLSNPTTPIWYVAKSGNYNTNPPTPLPVDSILTWDGSKWSNNPFTFSVVSDFIVVDSISQLRSMDENSINLIQNNTVKGVTVLGYYEKGDTPAPINYYLSNTTDADDGGSVIEVGGVKLQHFFNNPVNPLYYGVKKDGTESSDKMRLCVATGLDIIMTDGKYTFSKIDIKDRQNVISTSTLVEISPSVFEISDSNKYIFRISLSYNTIEGFTFFMPWGQEDVRAIVINKASRFIISKCRFSGGFSKNIEAEQPLYSTIEDCWFMHASNGVHAYGGGTFFNITKCSFLNHVGDYFIRLENMPSVVITDCHLGASDTANDLSGGIIYNSDGSFPTTYLIIDNCDIDSIKGNGIEITGGNTGAKTFDISITNNFISTGRDNTGNGIKITKADAVFISNNEVLDCGINSIHIKDCSNIKVHHNDIQYADNSNVLLDSSSNCIVTGNTVGSLTGEPRPNASALYGISEEGASNNNIITNNFAYELRGVAIKKTGSNTHCFGNKIKTGSNVNKYLDGKLWLGDGFDSGEMQVDNSNPIKVNNRKFGRYRSGSSGLQGIYDSFQPTQSSNSPINDTGGESIKNWYYGIESDLEFFSLPRFVFKRGGVNMFSIENDGAVNMSLQTLTSLPSSARTGRVIIYNSKICYYNGTKWVDCLGDNA